ncbi:MAG TPA: hypothetical protein P5121_16315 [Caldilineaceae bacterium]|nr:hypothetical protein [Caldilineaceae bacterium]
MSDADKVHAKLSGRHKSVYKKLCEGYFSEEKLADDELAALRNDIKGYGDAPIQFIQAAAQVMDQLLPGPLFGNNQTIDWSNISLQIEKLARQHALQSSDHRGMALALDACKKSLHEIQYGNTINHVNDIKIVNDYLLTAYEANFEEKIPLSQHYNNADPNYVEARVQAMRPHIEEHIHRLAENIAGNGKVQSLRRPQKKKRPVDINENLLG